MISNTPRTGGNSSCFGSATGNQTPLSPKYAISLGAAYTLDIGREGQLTFNGLLSRTGNLYFEADNRLRQPAVTVLNGSIEYRPTPHWGVEFFMNNITDKQYYLTGAGVANGDHGELAAPRTYGINVKVDF
jgi:iron complex outermembrane receptor protein